MLRNCLFHVAGLARVVDYLFTHDPNREQLRYMDVTAEDGVCTYGGFRRRLCGASALGSWSAAENRTLLNPKDSASVLPGDQMLVLSKRQPKFAPEAVISGVVSTAGHAAEIGAAFCPLSATIVFRCLVILEPG